MSKDSDKKTQTQSSGALKVIVWIIAVLILTTGALLAYWYYMVPVPEVFGNQLYVGSELKLDHTKPLKITFSTEMDQESVEKAFTITPDVEGDLKWEGNTLVFTPKAGSFDENQTIAVEISSEAKSKLQKQLTYNFYQQFKLVGPPEVILKSPQGDTQSEDVRITVVFDRPMRPLTTIQDEELYTPNFTFEPELEGFYKWRGAETVEFIPESMDPGTEYSVTVPKKMTSLFGDELAEDVTWSFNTVRPGVDSVSPVRMISARSSFLDYTYQKNFADYIDSEGTLTLQWNQRVSEDNVKEKLRVITEDEAKTEYEVDTVQCSLEGECIISFKDLPVEIPLRLELDKGVESEIGTLASENVYIVPFMVAGDFEVTYTSPEQDSESDLYGTVTFEFNHRVGEREEYEDLITVDPEVENFSVSEGRYYENELYVYGDFEASTAYTVTVSSDIADEFGTAIEEEYVLNFETLPLYPRLHFSERDDAFIETNEGDFLYPVTSLNVNSYKIRAAEVDMAEYIALITSETYYSWENEGKERYIINEYEREVSVDEMTINEAYIDPLNISQLFPELTFDAGMYYLELESVDTVRTVDRPRTASQVINIADEGVVFKYTPEELIVWVTDVKTGDVRTDTPVSIYYTDGALLAEGMTDGNGMYRLRWDETDQAALFEPDYDWLFPRLAVVANNSALAKYSDTRGIENWNFGLSTSFSEDPYRGYLYTDRPLYRPGQTVYFKGIVRNQDDTSYTLPDISSVSVKIYDNDYNEIKSEELAVNEVGSFSSSITLDEGAGLGGYSIDVSYIDEDNPDETEYITSDSFRVEEYKKPEYKVELETDKEEYMDNETITVTMNAEYYFGGALSNAPVTISVYSQDYYFSNFDDYRYSFGTAEGYYCFWCTIEEEQEYIIDTEDITNENGVLTFEIPIDLSDAKTSQLYIAEVGVTDPDTEQQVYASTSLVAHKGAYYMGVKSDEYVVKAGETASFSVISVDYDGEYIADITGTAELFIRTWDSIKKKNVDGYYYYESTPVDTLVEGADIKTGSDGMTSVEFTIPDGGQYVVKITSDDDAGNTVQSATTVYASSSEYVGWYTANNDRIEIIPDKQEYTVGDTAKLLVKSPYNNANVLLTHERRGIMHTEVTELTSNNQVVSIPITEEHVPNFYVSTVMVDANAEQKGFKMGYINVPVDPAFKELSIDVSSDKEYYTPREEATISVSITDRDGNPVDAEISVGVVDESLLALVGGFMEDPLARFYSVKPLAVHTATNLTRFVERIDVTDPSQGKGGGGGDMNEYLRSNFKDTAFWTPHVLAKDGKASVSFEMPDNLTSWQVMVVAHTEDTRVGAENMYIKTTKPLQVRPVIPRFAVRGDEMRIGAVVHNDTDEEQKTRISLATGPDLGMELSSYTEKIAAGGQHKFEWDLTIEDADMWQFEWNVEGGDYTDAVRVDIPVYKHVTPETVSMGGMVEDKELGAVVLPTYIDPELGSIEITSYATLLGTIQEPVSYLTDFEYLCAEQSVSKILPKVLIKQLSEANEDFVPPESWGLDSVDEDVEKTLQRLYNLQRYDGGFGFWETSINSDPNLTVYVLYGLHQIQEAGYSVEENVINEALAYLKTMDTDTFYERYYWLDPESNAFTYYDNYSAYVQYILSLYEDVEIVSDIQNLYDRRENLATYSKAFLALAFDNAAEFDLEPDVIQTMTTGRDTLKEEIIQNAKQSARGMHITDDDAYTVFFNTEIRSTAISALALQSIDEDNPLIPKMMHYLMNTKENGTWGSTQENIWALAAFIKYIEKKGELNADYSYSIYMNEEETFAGNFSQQNLFQIDTWTKELKDIPAYPAQVNIGFSKSGDGSLYYDTNVQYYLDATEIPAQFEGMGVYSEYFRTDDEELKEPVTELTLGEDYTVRVTVLVPDDRRYVMVEDYVPAGVELTNFSYATSSSRAEREFGDQTTNEDYPYRRYYIDYSELRDDRAVFFMDYVREGVYELFYQVRATTPGTFKVRPSHVHEMYYPDVFGRSEGYEVVVKEAQ